MNLSKLGNVGDFPNMFKAKPWNPQRNNAVISFHDSFMSSRPEGRTWSKVQGQLWCLVGFFNDIDLGRYHFHSENSYGNIR